MANILTNLTQVTAIKPQPNAEKAGPDQRLSITSTEAASFVQSQLKVLQEQLTSKTDEIQKLI